MRSSVTSTTTIEPVATKSRAHADADPAAVDAGLSTSMKSAMDTRRDLDSVMRLDEKENVMEKATQKEKDAADRFFWTYTEEPHRTRRQAIIKAHPEVRPIFLTLLQ